MVEVCLMVESEEGVAWEDWVNLAEACERYGVAGLFGADHYLSVAGRRDRGSLDVWTVLAGLGGVTERIRLGTLVSPVTFRHPSLLGKIAATVDHISGGRVEVGFGAGWFRVEHEAYGFPFPPLSARVDMLAEALRIVHQQWTEDVVSFQGRHYRLEQCPARSKPVQRPHPRIIVGGGGGPRSVAVAAQWADEYNVAGKTVEECSAIRARLDAACRRHGRRPGEIELSYMTATLLGRDRAELSSERLRCCEPGETSRTWSGSWQTPAGSGSSARSTKLPGRSVTSRLRVSGASISSTCSMTTWRWCGWPGSS
jgi:F420-dependent oxidoreductase-like protein